MTKMYNMCLTFIGEDGDDSLYVAIEVSEDVSKEDVAKALKADHEFLNSEDNEEFDITTPEGLLDYGCEKYGWKWHEIEFDEHLYFEQP